MENLHVLKIFIEKWYAENGQIYHINGWRTIWHRTQFGTGPNLAPRVLWGQFGTKSVKESIWHRTQFGTKSVKGVNLAPESIWHRTNLAPRVQKSQFGTGVNLAPESIWHHTNGTYFITLNMIQYKLWQNSQDMKETVPSSKFGNKGPVLKKFHPPLGP